MKVHKKKNFTLFLCALLTIGFVTSCGTQKDTSTADVSTVASEIEQPENVDKLKKYDPVITLSTVRAEGNYEFPEGEDYENNDIYKLFEETMGVKIVNEIQCPASAVKEKMQMAIASNDIPDFGVVDSTMLQTMIKNDMLEDMTDYYNTWATDNLKSVTEQADKALFTPATRNDRYMALPLANTIGDQMPILYIRSDWLNALNLEPPKTMEEMFEIAEAFTTQDPDGNGVKDTYGLLLDKDLTNAKYIFAGYGAYSEQWNKQEDGSYVAGCTDPRMKDGLLALQKLYGIGGLDPEFAIKDAVKAAEMISAGKVGMRIDFFWQPLNELKDCVANIEGADWMAVAMPPSEKIDKYLIPTELNLSGGFLYVKKGIEHPEAAVVMMNHICDGYGAPWLVGEDTDFALGYQKIAQDPKYKNTAVNAMMPFAIAGNINWGPVFQEAIDNGEEHVFGKDQDYQNVISAELPPEVQWAWKKTYLEAYPILGDFENLHYNDYTGAPTDTLVKVQSLLDKERLTTFISIIMGEKDIDEFDAFVERYNSMGAEKVAKEIQEIMSE